MHENAGDGDDTVYARVNYALPDNVETLYLLGSATHGSANDHGSVLVANPELSSTLKGEPARIFSSARIPSQAR